MTSSGDAITRRERKPKPFRCTGCLVEPGACSPLLFYFSLFPFCPPLSLLFSCFPPSRDDDIRSHPGAALARTIPRGKKSQHDDGPLPSIHSSPPPPSFLSTVVNLKRARFPGPACDGFSTASQHPPTPLQSSMAWRGTGAGGERKYTGGGSLRGTLACRGTMRAAGLLNDGQV